MTSYAGPVELGAWDRVTVNSTGSPASPVVAVMLLALAIVSQGPTISTGIDAVNTPLV